MKKIIAAIILTATTALTTAQPDTEVPRLDVMTGNYYDYMVVETADGNVWMVDEVFNDGELVQVSFDTKGTADVTDDEILKIRSINSRY